MSRNKSFGQLVPGDRVQVICQSNQKTSEAEVVSATKSGLVLVLPGYVRLQMRQHPTQRDLYTTNQFGLEFHCRV